MEPPEVKLTIRQAVVLDADVVRSSEDVEMTEERMRRALGLGGPSARPILTTQAAPSRQGGSGPVAPGSLRCRPNSVGAGNTPTGAPSSLQQRVTELEQRLAVERQKHNDARQLLQRAELANRHQEMRSQHEALAQQQELSGERQATVRAQRALDEALFDLRQRTEAQRSARGSSQEQDSPRAANLGSTITVPATTTLKVVRSVKAAAIASSPQKLGRPRTRPMPEPKAVRWWTPSFRAKAKR